MNSNILQRPVITEKSMKAAAAGEYTFAVDKKANKIEIARAAAQNFGVKVLKVRTMTVPGKTKRAGKYRQEKTGSGWKKAIIKVAAGQKINLFDVTETPVKN